MDPDPESDQYGEVPDPDPSNNSYGSASLPYSLGYEGTVGHEEGEADEDEHPGRHPAHWASNPARVVDGRPTADKFFLLACFFVEKIIMLTKSFTLGK